MRHRTQRSVGAASLGIAVLFAIGTMAAEAADEKQRDAQRMDLFGDPLPAGAIARFGTIRLKHKDVECVAFSPDGEMLATGG
ncbi:MAG: hypothetical protein IH991_23980 [Planctomycetes bacterium]|nr:hypothetical protein [Planctomycetota bacterium]